MKSGFSSRIFLKKNAQIWLSRPPSMDHVFLFKFAQHLKVKSFPVTEESGPLSKWGSILNIQVYIAVVMNFKKKCDFLVTMRNVVPFDVLRSTLLWFRLLASTQVTPPTPPPPPLRFAGHPGFSLHITSDVGVSFSLLTKCLSVMRRWRRQPSPFARCSTVNPKAFHERCSSLSSLSLPRLWTNIHIWPY